MEKYKEKQYWKELFPFWKNAFVFWIPLPTWGQVMTGLLIAILPITFIFIISSDVPNFLTDVVSETTRWWFSLGWIIFISFIAYIRANISLYTKKEKEVEDLNIKLSNEEIDLNILTSPTFEKEVFFDGKKRKLLTLEVYNNAPNKKIVELGVQAIVIYSHTIIDQKVIPDFVSAENLIWLYENEELIEIRPNNKSEVIIAFLEERLLSTRRSKQSEERETVYQFNLKFSGKYEGETNFRNRTEIRSIYYSPAINKLAFTNVASDYPNVHPKLREIMNIMNDGIFYTDNF